MPLGNNPTQNLATGLTHLGRLSKLPNELRCIIWEFLLFDRGNTLQPIFSISRCNRYLHNEVSSYFYHLVSHVLVLRPNYHTAWGVELTFGKLQNEFAFKQNRTLKKYIDAFLIAKVSHPTLQLQVDIHPSSYNDRGRIICLWKRANDFVKMLEQSSHQHARFIKPSVRVRLVGEWVKDGRYRHSTTGRGRDIDAPIILHQYRISHFDHDIVALPFLQLDASFDLPPQLCNLISQEPKRESYPLLYKFVNEPRDDSGQSDSFDQEIMQMAIEQVEHWMRVFSLTEASGHTGMLVRRDRLRTSSHEDDSWESDDPHSIAQGSFESSPRSENSPWSSINVYDILFFFLAGLI